MQTNKKLDCLEGYKYICLFRSSDAFMGEKKAFSRLLFRLHICIGHIFSLVSLVKMEFLKQAVYRLTKKW